MKDWYFGTKEGVLNFETGQSKTYYASLIHDVFYQFAKDVRAFVKRKEVDLEFYKILRRDGFRFARLYYLSVRAFGWILLLRETGIISGALQWAGLSSGPVELLYNDITVVIGMVYTVVLFMIVPLVSTSISIS